jgi:hypothetical protein
VTSFQENVLLVVQSKNAIGIRIRKTLTYYIRQEAAK